MMRKSIAIFILLAFVGLFLSGCHNLITGAGNIIEVVSYPDNPVSKIELTSDFTVYLTQDSFYETKVQGYENLVSHVTITEDNGKLTIGTQQDYIFEENNIVVYITAPNFTEVKLNSSGSILSTDSITTNTLEITNNAAGTISIYGDANIVNAYSAGTGLTRLCAMQADTVNAFMLGSGYLSTKPMNVLNAQVQGSGQIQYLGSPALNFNITGTGSLMQTLGCY